MSLAQNVPMHLLRIVLKRNPNPHLAKMQLMGSHHFRHAQCGRIFERSENSFQFRKRWQTWRCDCGALLRIPPVGGS